MRTNYDKKVARLQFQSANMLENHNEKILNESETIAKKNVDSLYEHAYESIGTHIHNTRVKEQDNARRFGYANHFTELAVTEALAECVNRALLLNTEEYEKLNPNYKNEIRESVASLIGGNGINESINNPFMNALFEEIKNEMPPAELYLTEDEEKEIVVTKIMPKETINNSIDSLIGDVRARVANIVAKDQEALAAEKNDMDYIEQKEMEAAPVAPVSEIIDDTVQDPELAMEAPVDNFANQPAPVQEACKPKLKTARESSKKGIVECLAINEATQMLAEGKEYNKTLALANTVKYITVLEALDASGVVSIGNAGYNRILSACGVNMNPVSKSNIPGSSIANTAMLSNEVDAAPVAIKMPSESKEEVKIKNDISDIVRNSFPTAFTLGNDSKMFAPFAEWEKNASNARKAYADIPSIHESKEATYKGLRGDILTESQLRAKFEREGFDLDYVDFEDLARDWHYVKK